MIHKYKLNNLNIVLDVHSGSVHLVDDVVYDALDFRGNQRALAQAYPPYALAEALQEIGDLRRQGLLFSEDTTPQVWPRVRERQPVVKALCLHVAHDCNLRCRYCFAQAGAYGGGRGLMSQETARQAVDFLLAHSGGRRNLEVDFFGGEPLLNFPVVRDTVLYAREAEKRLGKSIRFTLTTNGLLLDDTVQDFLNQHMYNLVLSLDGRPQVHDRMRPCPGGGGSYEEALPKILRLVEHRGHKNYYVRGTYTRHNLDFTQDVLHLAGLGFNQISMEPVAAGPEAPYALTPADLPALLAQYETLAKVMLERERAGHGFVFFHYRIDLTGGPCVAKRLTGCGAGTEYLAVAPDGGLYPCHQFVGKPEFKMGQLPQGALDEGLRQRFGRCGLPDKPGCDPCFAKYYCGGGCAAAAYAAGGSLTTPNEMSCQLERKRVECAIMLAAALGAAG